MTAETILIASMFDGRVRVTHKQLELEVIADTRVEALRKLADEIEWSKVDKDTEHEYDSSSTGYSLVDDYSGND